MAILTTTTGSKWNTEIPARSNLVMHLNDKGQQVMSTLTIVSIAGTHEEFRQIKTDLIVKDQFGETYEICEDYIWQ